MQRLLTLLVLLAFVAPAALAQNAVQNLRPADQRGLNVFETPKDTSPYQGFKVDWSAAFAQQFQALDHSNTAGEAPNADGVNQNALYRLGNGFNLATANLGLDAQLAKGVRVNLVTYLSSRHHQETWVKGGYLQVDDASFLGVPALDKVFEYVTVKAGHYEINYGDAHFRRTDNGNAMFNPFVGNLLLDAFTTEIGGEVTAQYRGGLAVLGVTGGEIKGDVFDSPDEAKKRAPAIYAKLGYDRQLHDDLRVRLTGSTYTTSSSASNTLYAGDRAGSRYYLVMENTAANATANFRSGMINPGFSDKVTSFMVNPFVKFHGLEVFGVIETASGRGHTETADRTWNQYAVDALYRFLPQEQLYVGARYNLAKGESLFPVNGTPTAMEVSAQRYAFGAGWFVTPNVLTKVEYVNQEYKDFPHANINCGGQFNGFMVEGVIAF